MSNKETWVSSTKLTYYTAEELENEIIKAVLYAQKNNTYVVIDSIKDSVFYGRKAKEIHILNYNK